MVLSECCWSDDDVERIFYFSEIIRRDLMNRFDIKFELTRTNNVFSLLLRSRLSA